MLSTTELVRQTMEDTKELVRIELKLAREEIRDDLLQLKTVAILLGVAAVLAVLVLSSLIVAIVIALGGTVVVALVATGVLAVGSGAMAIIARKHFPKVPLQRTRARLKSDINQLKEHVV
jgi:uncharacterized membrane protein YqjE